MKKDPKKEQLQDILLETKAYISLQKEYLQFTLAEQTTRVLSTIAVTAVCALLAFVVFVLIGLALVHWIGEAIGNIGLCYAVFGLFTFLFLAIFYANRRKWVTLPIARMMEKVFLPTPNADEHE